MAAFNFRYYTWLLQAYVKKWKKTILTSLLGGIIIFFLFIFFIEFYLIPQFQKKAIKIGYEGVYTTSTIPSEILDTLSYGLTKVNENGEVKGAAASSWEIKDGGKEYVFHLKKNLAFQDGEKLQANRLSYNFKDVKTKIIDQYTVSYRLNTPYAPFLTSVAKPIFKDYFVGLGGYKLSKIDLNAGFIKQIVLQKVSDPRIRQTILFYPTQDALKTAFLLGEIDEIQATTDLNVLHTSLKKWNNATVMEKTDYQDLVTLFYNNEDDILSDKKVRQALNYAIPEKFKEGIRAYSSIPPESIYFSKSPNYGISDTEIAKTLLTSSKTYQGSVISITTTPEYKDVAESIKDAWAKIGIKSKVIVAEGIPSQFQTFIYRFKVPKDPDQYTLWHSQGINNIANYRKSIRIDKLLEEGRLTIDNAQRIKVYADFQKYLLDDVPASFLYYPTVYTVKKN